MELAQPSPSPLKEGVSHMGEQILQQPFSTGSRRVPSSSESSYISTTGSRTPKRVSTSGTNTSPSKAFMTLTPIKLPEDYSPSRNPLFCSSSKPQVTTTVKSNQLESYSPTHETMYTEKFNGISEQLATLLGNLNVIYQKIGYTSSDITSKEKFVFHELSSQLKTFYNEAEEEMKQLSTDNDNDQDILNKILVILGDPSGIETIPDLYIRNAILKPSNKKVPQSPKKQLTLLNQKTSLTKAKNFILKVYIPKLISFLQKAVQLQRLLLCLDREILNEDMAGLTDILPSLEVSETALADLEQTTHSPTKDRNISQTLHKHKHFLFDDAHCADISLKTMTYMDKAIEIYQGEFNSRKEQAESVVYETRVLMNKLDEDPEEGLNAPLFEFFSSFINTLELSNVDDTQGKRTTKSIVVSHRNLETLQQILNHYLSVKDDRIKEKNKWISSCQKLWEMLKVPEAYIAEFLERNNGLSLLKISLFKAEKEKMEEKMKQQIKQLITEALGEINKLWDTLSIETEHRDQFSVSLNQLLESAQILKDEENILVVCNNEIKDMKEKMKLYEPILKLIDEFHSLKEDEQFLEYSSKDSSRLLSRNSHKILLKEETTRKRITRHFPRVFAELSAKLVEAEDSFKRPFLHKNKPMLDIVLQEEEAFFHKYPRSRRIASGERVVRARKERIASNSSTTSTGTVTSTVSEPAAPLASRVAAAKPYKVVKRFNSDGSNSQTTHKDIPRKKVVRKELRPHLTEAHLAKNSQLLAEKPLLVRHNTDSAVLVDHHTSRLMVPTRITRTPGSARPDLNRTHSAGKMGGVTTPTILSTPRRPGTIASHGVVPTQLFPMSDNQMNNLHRSVPPTNAKPPASVSRIPSLGKTRTIISTVPSTLIENKENSMLQPKLLSPYREPEHSVYQLSQSPDGKYKLSIQQRALENPFDDTSLLEE